MAWMGACVVVREMGLVVGAVDGTSFEQRTEGAHLMGGRWVLDVQGEGGNRIHWRSNYEGGQ
eukprot:5542306-Prorocentrum_lima.AAC.1